MVQCLPQKGCGFNPRTRTNTSTAKLAFWNTTCMGFLCTFRLQSSGRHLFPLIKTYSNLWISAVLILHILCATCHQLFMPLLCALGKTEKSLFLCLKMSTKEHERNYLSEPWDRCTENLLYMTTLWWYSLGAPVKNVSFILVVIQLLRRMTVVTLCWRLWSWKWAI